MSVNHIVSKHDLIAYLSMGHKAKYIYFWGHEKKADAVSKTCFSQWYDAPFECDGCLFKTAEHFMMAEKAKLFGDMQKISEILKADNPGKAKALGRSINNFDQKIWDEKKFQIVVRGCFEKFNSNVSLRDFLLNTGDRILVEASPVDQVWGVGLAADDPLIENPNNWLGENHLGFALMKARHIIIEQKF